MSARLRAGATLAGAADEMPQGRVGRTLNLRKLTQSPRLLSGRETADAGRRADDGAERGG